MIYEGKLYTLPFHLGEVGVFSRKPTKWKIFNFQHYKDTGQKIPRLNLHSQELTASVKRRVKGSLLGLGMYQPILHAFKFEACRAFNRELSKAISNENTIGLYTEYELRKH